MLTNFLGIGTLKIDVKDLEMPWDFGEWKVQDVLIISKEKFKKKLARDYFLRTKANFFY